MSSDASVTHWIGLLRAGAAATAPASCERYCRRLVGLARKKLQDTRRLAADEEAVALSAFDSFCRGAEREKSNETLNARVAAKLKRKRRSVERKLRVTR